MPSLTVYLDPHPFRDSLVYSKIPIVFGRLHRRAVLESVTRNQVFFEVMGRKRLTPDEKGHLWVFYEWRMVEPGDWYSDPNEIIDRAVFECLHCGLHMFLDCKYRLSYKISEPVPSSATWKCCGKPCIERQMDQAVILVHES